MHIAIQSMCWQVMLSFWFMLFSLCDAATVVLTTNRFKLRSCNDNLVTSGYLILKNNYTVSDLWERSRDLFDKVCVLKHSLHHLLIRKFREHDHSYSMPEYNTCIPKKSFIVRSLSSCQFICLSFTSLACTSFMQLLKIFINFILIVVLNSILPYVCLYLFYIMQFITSPLVGVRSIAMSVSVCLAYVCMFVRSRMSKTPCANVTKFLCILYLWTWIGPPLMTMQFVRYFRCCEWRHVAQ